jgi:putative protease
LGIAVGTTSEARIARGRTWLGVRLSESLARGDGILVEAAKDEPELGGRVWEILVRGEDVLGARSGDEAHVWLGPTHDGAVSSKGRRVFKTSDPANQRAILEKVERDPVRVPVDMTFRGRIGEPFELQARSERGHVARVKGDACLEVARQAPLTPQAIRDKLAKLGDTPFVLGELDLDIPDGIIFPISSLNRARRALAEALIASVHADREPAATSTTPAPRAPPGDPPAGGLFVLCRNEAQALAAADSGATGVVLDFPALTGTGDTVRTLRARYPSVFVTLTPPRIRKPGEEKIDRYLCGLAPDGLLVRSLGALAEARDACDGIGRIGDYSLNVANVHSVAEVLSAGLLAFTPAFDLDTNQLTDLCASELGPWAEVVVHHPTPLFHMEHCIFAALLSTGHDHRTCGRPCEKHSVNLRDRRGMHHPLEADVGCRNTVFHAAAQSAASVVPTLVASGVRRFRIEVVRETAADVAMLVQSYGALIENRKSPAEVMHDVKASHGLVSGSLRVVL